MGAKDKIMYRIYKIASNPVVDFAAEELKKYLRMMMPRCGEIIISYDPEAKEGFRLGLMENFGQDTSKAEEQDLDDIVHIDTDENGGIIAGNNVCSVLLAVYKYLTLCGCRWLFPSWTPWRSTSSAPICGRNSPPATACPTSTTSGSISSMPLVHCALPSASVRM